GFVFDEPDASEGRRNRTERENGFKSNEWLHGFRHSSPYINARRGRTVVLTMPGDAIEHRNFINIIHDIALLSSLGVRLVVAFGGRPQIQSRLDDAGLESAFARGLRITPDNPLPLVMEAIGGLRAYLESQLSMGLVNSPMHNARIRVTSGNYVTAKPVGVLDGVDFGYTGKVRRVDTRGIEQLLELGHIVLLPPMGYSPTGEDRKSTRLNSSHVKISYAVFCLKKKKELDTGV